ncbi:hypothetical protein [Saccharopolyspora spinosa]|uniref:Uncharacterized protein n=1 Tax=Saccharopolyspora spinosa TaxID=60894 RepID=A0A2N3Y5X8_SACSN|nr:hypothetical protein A8926_6382 [Saccharopolyspora spinosa]
MPPTGAQFMQVIAERGIPAKWQKLSATEASAATAVMIAMVVASSREIQPRATSVPARAGSSRRIGLRR